ncbi:hypothetical protein [Colwellia sp. Arc7-D]|uniref:hypothetical protein n=1 Tax=Colwellia sp. Arc7-D TaxID=2161872 RepID=UPI001EF194DF|nr:hypothetical protein [Colwellia sp. Arc7-D]
MSKVIAIKPIPKGVALITVMLIIALIAILATQMTARLQLQMQRTTNIGSNQQAYWYAMGLRHLQSEYSFNHLKPMPK